MVGKPGARITDMHVCPAVNPGPVPHVGGPILTGMATVLVGKMPAARVSDVATCVGPPDSIVKGSSGVFIGGLPAARIGDSCAHGGAIATGFPTVLIGESSSGSGGSAGSGSGSGGAAKSMINKPCLKMAANAGAPFVRG